MPRADASARPTPPIRLALGLLLVAATVWTFANGTSGVLLLDDVRSIAQNPHIRSLSAAFTAPPETTLSARPVASLTFALNYATSPENSRDVFAPDLTGRQPDVTRQFLDNVAGYHWGNILIHVAAVLVLFGVIRRTAHDAWLACAVALVWAVHPLQSESVTYLVQRVESLMGLWFLLTLYCAIRAWEQPHRIAWAAAAVAACALGMGTKASMAGAPIAVLLWDWIFAERPSSSRAPWRWALYFSLAATWSLAVALAILEPRVQSVGFGLRGWTAWTYLLTQTQVIAHYLRLALWPRPLVLLYQWPMARGLGDVLVPASLLLALAAATVLAIARRHPVGFAGGCFFLVLAPTSSVLPIVTEIAAEHRMYLPLASVAAVILGAVFWLLKRVLPPGRREWAGRTTLVVATVVALMLGVETRARNAEYDSESGMWLDVIAKQPDNSRAHLGYGITLLRAGQYAAAEEQLQTAVNLEPGSAVSLENLGAARLGAGRLEEALPLFTRALQISPDYADAHHNLGLALAALGRVREAIPHLEAASSAEPDNVPLLEEVARAQAATGQPAAAAATIRRGLAVASHRSQTGDVVRLERLLKTYEAMIR